MDIPIVPEKEVLTTEFQKDNIKVKVEPKKSLGIAYDGDFQKKIF